MTTELAITGAGWLTPDGAGSPADVLRRSAGLQPDRFADARFAAAVADEASQQQLGPHGGFGHRLAGLVVTAGREALRQAALPEEVARNRLGCVLGTTFSGQTAMIGFGRQLKKSGSRFVTPLQFPETVGNYAASTAARLLDLQGPNLTVCSGTTSGLTAIVEACELLESGAVDHVIAGGADVLDDELVDGLASAAGVDADEQRPSLAGSYYAEGACVFALECAEHARRRGVGILAIVQPIHDATSRSADLVAVEDTAPDTLALLRRQATHTGHSENQTAVTAPNQIWGAAFAMGSAGQAAAVLAALAGAPVPVLSGETDRLAWSGVEGASTGLALAGGRHDASIAITAANSG